ncbi:MAG: hypothetical protein FJZ63_06155 [Chlamydiae bacterium]|nr:hypothetical protein [Chlamydiota bacterium]
MKVKRKKNFTLLEVLLAFALLSTVLALIFHFLKTSALLQTRAQTLHNLCMEKMLLHQRLSHLLSKVEPCLGLNLQQGHSAFYTQEGWPLSLHFTCNHGIDPEETFTGPLQGHLHLEKGNLLLDLTPPKSSSTRQQLLLTGVKDLSFLFYKRPSLVARTSGLPKESFEVSSTWSSKDPDIPYSMTLSLTLLDGTALNYTFFLSSTPQPIFFES